MWWLFYLWELFDSSLSGIVRRTKLDLPGEAESADGSRALL